MRNSYLFKGGSRDSHSFLNVRRGFESGVNLTPDGEFPGAGEPRLIMNKCTFELEGG